MKKIVQFSPSSDCAKRPYVKPVLQAYELAPEAGLLQQASATGSIPGMPWEG